jgi:hypothetical protein
MADHLMCCCMHCKSCYHYVGIVGDNILMVAEGYRGAEILDITVLEMKFCSNNTKWNCYIHICYLF